MTTTFDAARELRTTQLVVLALPVGIVLFAAVAAYAGPLRGTPSLVVNGKDVLAIAALIVSLSALPLSFVVSARLVEAARQLEPVRRVAAFRASRVVAAALCEGAALLWCVTLLLSGNLLYLAAIALVVAVMLLHVPTRQAFEDATGERVRDA